MRQLDRAGEGLDRARVPELLLDVPAQQQRLGQQPVVLGRLRVRHGPRREDERVAVPPRRHQRPPAREGLADRRRELGRRRAAEAPRRRGPLAAVHRLYVLRDSINRELDRPRAAILETVDQRRELGAPLLQARDLQVGPDLPGLSRRPGRAGALVRGAVRPRVAVEPSLDPNPGVGGVGEAAAEDDRAQPSATAVAPDPRELLLGVGARALLGSRSGARDAVDAEPERGDDDGARERAPPRAAAVAGELGEQRVHRGPAIRRRGHQPAREDAPKPGRHARATSWIAERPGQRRLGDRVQRVAGVGALAVERLVETDAEAELVGARPCGRAAILLRRHVGGRPEDRARRRQLDREQVRALERAGVRRRAGAGGRRRGGAAGGHQAEVEHARAPVIADEHVLRFKVAVDQADGVRGREPSTCLYEHVDDAALDRPDPREWEPLEPGAQRPPAQQLHRDEDLPPVAPDLVDLHDVRVGQAREPLGLPEQPLLRLAAAAATEQQLDRHGPVELVVVGRVDLPHAAGAEPPQDDVAADRLRDRGRARGRGPLAGTKHGHRVAADARARRRRRGRRGRPSGGVAQSAVTRVAVGRHRGGHGCRRARERQARRQHVYRQRTRAPAAPPSPPPRLDPPLLFAEDHGLVGQPLVREQLYALERGHAAASPEHGGGRRRDQVGGELELASTSMTRARRKRVRPSRRRGHGA